MIKKRKRPAARGSPTPKKIAFDLNDANDPDHVDIEEYEADFVIWQVDEDDDIVSTKEEVTVDSTVVTADGGDHEESETELLHKCMIPALESSLRESQEGKRFKYEALIQLNYL